MEGNLKRRSLNTADEGKLLTIDLRDLAYEGHGQYCSSE